MDLNADKRQSKRLPLNYNARIGKKNKPGRISFITDISEGGVCLKTNTVFAPGTEVCLVITIEKISYEIEGVVAWGNKVPPAIAHQVKGSMGIRFTEVNKELLDLYNEKLLISVYVEPK